jgi:transposase InsO family protein
MRGKTVTEVAESLNRSTGWVSKWYQRFQEEGWSGIEERSRARHTQSKRLSESVRQAIFEARLELEAEAALGTKLKYVGGRAVRTRLKEKKVSPLPSIPSIERVLQQMDLTRPKKTGTQVTIVYPHLQPTEPHQLCQVDIFPQFLRGGQRVACFNALDVVSHYPTGQAQSQRRSEEAAAFLLHVWQELGIAAYTQVDNEGCFSGGMTHPYVLGKVVRLALEVGTELVFSPVNHPKSNCVVERFHQDYNRHVWQDTYLANLTAVQRQAESFFQQYRQRRDHAALDEQTPNERHHQSQSRPFVRAVSLSTNKRPLYEGAVHFIRRVTKSGTVRVLNVDWQVSNFDPSKGVWVTLQLRTKGATLSIFDAAPDVKTRKCLAIYPFPLKEIVQPYPANETLLSIPVGQHLSPEATVTPLTGAATVKPTVAAHLNQQSRSTAFVWQ